MTDFAAPPLPSLPLVGPSALGSPLPLAPSGAALAKAAPADREEALRAVAREFESVFLAEMLRHTGLAEAPEAFSGGAGEEAFRSFLLREYAETITTSGGFGLADRLYAQLSQRLGADETPARELDHVA